MANAQVLIVGAGPTGLVLALRLARLGVSLRIIDAASGPGQASRAMVVQARTLEYYQQMGICDAVVAQGIKVGSAHLLSDGQPVVSVHLGNLGKGVSPFPFVLCYPQDDHERFLVAQLNALGVLVEWETSLQGLTQDSQQVQARLLCQGQPQECVVSYLCGCDGAHSRVRQELAITFTGGTYDQEFYVADVQLQGRHSDAISINFGDHDFCFTAPVRRGGSTRLIGTLPSEMQGRSGLTFDDVRPYVEEFQRTHITSVQWFSTYRVQHRVADHFRVGRSFLLGDAGHLHSPAGGQGMNTGIGDAVNLAWKLHAVLRGARSAILLDSYEDERIAFARALVATTDTVFSGMVNQGRGGQVLRTAILPHVLPWLTGFSTVQHLLFKTVSQVRISYRSSELSLGKAGEIHAGDRLPWVASAGQDNFQVLTSMCWRLQVYGEASAALREACSAWALPLDVFPWSDAAKLAGLAQDAIYVIRPDGYVGYASADQSVSALQLYGERFSLFALTARGA